MYIQPYNYQPCRCRSDSIPVPALRDSAYLTAVHPVAAPPLSVVSDEALRMTSCPSEDRDIRRRQLSQLRVILRVPDELNLKEIFQLEQLR